MPSPHWLERISPCIRLPNRGSRMRSYTGHHRHKPGWLEPLRVIYDYELVLFSEGRFVVEIEGQRHDCPAGSFIIIPPGHWHVSWEAARRFGHRHWTHFDWVYQGAHEGPRGETPIMTFSPEAPRPELYRWAPKFVPQQIFHGPVQRFQRVMEISERLSALQNTAQPHARRVSRALLLELLIELFDEIETENTTTVTELRLEDKVRQLLDQHVEKLTTVRVEDLLEQTGYSYAHVCRVFKKRYGIPPLKYLHLLCITRAKLLLRDTDLPVGTIAERLSFSDPEYFAQLFRRNVGASPTAYRMRIRSG